MEEGAAADADVVVYVPTDPTNIQLTDPIIIYHTGVNITSSASFFHVIGICDVFGGVSGPSFYILHPPSLPSFLPSHSYLTSPHLISHE